MRWTVYKHLFDQPDSPDKRGVTYVVESGALVEAGNQAVRFISEAVKHGGLGDNSLVPRYQINRGAYYAFGQQRPAWYVYDSETYVFRTDKDRIAVFYVVKE